MNIRIDEPIFIEPGKLITITAFLFLIQLASAQSVSARSNQAVPAWTVVNTKDAEFSILMPARPPMLVRENGVLGRNRVRINVERTVRGFQDGVIFVVKIYDTPSPKTLLSDYFSIFFIRKADIHEISYNGYQGRQYLRNDGTIYHNIQCFATKQRVYVAEVAARNERNPLIKRFLSSLKLGSLNSTNTGSYVMSDNSADQNSMSLTSTAEQSRVYKKSEVTNPAITLYIPAPPSYLKGISGEIKLKMVYSSSGEVRDVSVESGYTGTHHQLLIDLAKQIVFLPAEKDGHYVSQYVEVIFNFH